MEIMQDKSSFPIVKMPIIVSEKNSAPQETKSTTSQDKSGKKVYIKSRLLAAIMGGTVLSQSGIFVVPCLYKMLMMNAELSADEIKTIKKGFSEAMTKSGLEEKGGKVVEVSEKNVSSKLKKELGRKFLK